MIVLFLKENIVRKQNKISLLCTIIWLCIILMDAANQVAAYIMSKLDLWSQQPIRWTDLFLETLISIINQHKMQI